MRKVKVIMAVAAALVFTWLSVSTIQAKVEYSKKEGKACTYCHVKASGGDLNDAGKCYKDNGYSLAKCGK